MTIDDLKNKQLFKLSKDEINEIKIFLVNCSKDDAKNYILHVLDNEYIWAETEEQKKAAEKFLSDKQFNSLRDEIYNETEEDILEYVDEIKETIKLLSKDGWSDISRIAQHFKDNGINYDSYKNVSDFITQNVANVEIVDDHGFRKCRLIS